jgi:uncharacterized protein (TIGR02246 family)
MNKNHFSWAILCIALFASSISCNSSDEDSTTKVASQSTEQQTAKPDMAAVKTEIQALETAWSNADNARDVKALAAFYSDDAVSMGNNVPMLVGKTAIQKDIEAGLAKKAKGSTTSYEVLDVFGCENEVTETGKITRKDSTGKVISTGKYMAVWEKRDGKYICVRDIGNEDVKEK